MFARLFGRGYQKIDRRARRGGDRSRERRWQADVGFPLGYLIRAICETGWDADGVDPAKKTCNGDRQRGLILGGLWWT